VAPAASVMTVAEHVLAAETVSDLALARLRERGVFSNDDDFEKKYVEEIAAVGKTFGVHYYERGA